MNNKLSLLILLLSLGMLTVLNGQTLRGNVVGERSEIITDAVINIIGGDEQGTDDQGVFYLDISKFKVGQTLTLLINSDYGSKQMNYVVPSNPRFETITLRRNNKLFILGTVQDKVTGRFLSGIKVTILINGYEFDIPSTTTDDRGIFKMILNKSGIGDETAIQLTFIDVGHNRYGDYSEKVFVKDRGAIAIELEECSYCGSRDSLRIDGYYRSDIAVEPGDLVIIRAGGVIRVGSFVGVSGPGGLPNNRGVFGLSLASYNNFPNWNHAVLVYRFNDYEDWRFYQPDKENKFLVQEAGKLEFWINDRILEDNEGVYEVEVIVKR